MTRGGLKSNLGILVCLFLLAAHGAESLKCYQCSVPESELSKCPVVTCQSGEMCFIERETRSPVPTITARCDRQVCNNHAVSLIGRMVHGGRQSRDVDGRCCSTDLCNSCVDDSNVNCRVVKTIICSSLESATRLCPFTCNLCPPIASPASTTMSPSTVGTSPAMWLEWTSPTCRIVEGICFAIRSRQCTTGTSSDCTGLDYDSDLCSGNNCNSVPSSTPVSSPPTTSSRPSHVTKSPTTIHAMVSTPAVPGVTQCADSGTYNCDAVKDIICDDQYLMDHCNKTCGRCVAVPLTPVCQDSGRFHCDIVKDFVCRDDDMKRFCIKTCGLCGVAVPSTPVCQDSGRFHCDLVKDFVCIDNDMKYSCNKTCGLCGGKIVPSSTPVSSPPTTSSRPIHVTKSPTTIYAMISTPAVSVAVPSTPVCEDSGRFHCDLVKDAVCIDDDMKYSCNKTCGLCGGGCVDTVPGCLEPEYQSVVCQDPALGAKYCPKSCKLC